MSSSTKSTPARRLTRTSNQFQPVVKQSLESQGRYNHNWNGEPIATRPAVFQDDSDVDGDDEQNLQTHFYGSFIRKSWKNSKKDNIPDNDIFEIGDTVLVNTHSNVRFPSVGVIIAMWQTCFPAKKSGSRVSGVALEERKMKVKIHWFIRPTELPTNRAYRECKENEIYYSLTATQIITPHEIRSHGTVTSNKNAILPPIEYVPTNRLYTTDFYCAFSVDSGKGLFYSFIWEKHLNTALELKEENSWNVEVTEGGEADDGDSVMRSPTRRAARPPKKYLALSASKRDRTTREEDGTEDLLDEGDTILVTTPRRKAKTIQKRLSPSAKSSDHDEPPSTPTKPRTLGSDSATNKPVRTYLERRKRARLSQQKEDESDDELAIIPSRKGTAKQASPSPSTSDHETVPKTPTKNRKAATQHPATPRTNGKRARPKDVEDSEDDVIVVPAKKKSKSVKKKLPSPSPSASPEEPSESGAESPPPPPSTPKRKRKRPVSDSESASASESEEEEEEVVTPRRRGRPPKSKAAPTPHSKAALRKRRALKNRIPIRAPNFTSLQSSSDLSHLPRDAHLRAMHLLHVGSRPDTLPCREDEFVDVLGRLVDLLEEGAGGCVYISGVPGTGKTATVHAVVRELRQMAVRNETSPFTYVEINGLKIPEPTAAYPLLWDTLSGSDGQVKVSSKEALKRLDRYFAGGQRGPAEHACVVLMDELDQLVTTKQDVVYNFFNWPTLPGSKLIVIAVANTMDLPERALSGKVRSRLGMARVTFKPYTKQQLQTILNTRLEGACEGIDGMSPEKVMAPDAITFASMKVSSISGDARRVLDICRRAVEQAHNASGPSPAVRTSDVSKVISEMQNSPTAVYLSDCTSFHERVMICAVWKCVKREGINEIKWDDVAYQHVLLLQTLSSFTEGSTRRPSSTELQSVLASLLASRALIMEDGGGGKKGSIVAEGDRRVMLNIEEAEVVRVLGEKGGDRWKSTLGV